MKQFAKDAFVLKFISQTIRRLFQCNQQNEAESCLPSTVFSSTLETTDFFRNQSKLTKRKKPSNAQVFLFGIGLAKHDES